jgi:hypothetical protein
MTGHRGFVTWLGLSVVLAAAAVLSFSALAELAAMVGMSRRLVWLFPVCTDAGVAVSTAEVGPIIQLGGFFWDQDQGANALRLMRDVVADLPRSMNALPAAALNAPPAPFVPVEHHNKLGYALLLVGFGDPGEHEQVVDRIRQALPPLFDFVTPMPYTALQPDNPRRPRDRVRDPAGPWPGRAPLAEAATAPTPERVPVPHQRPPLA